MPSQRVLQKYDLLQFAEVAQAVRLAERSLSYYIEISKRFCGFDVNRM